MIPSTLGLYTDFYELTMAQAHFNDQRHTTSSGFDYFFRSNPFNAGYTIFAGLSDLLDGLEYFHFSDEDCAFLSSEGFQDDFVDYLRDFKFSGSIYSMREGEIVFPNEPIVRVEAPVVEAQILETFLLNILNFESLIATKTNRIVQAARGKAVLDFGLRRSQGFGGFHASKAAIIGGAQATSNALSGRVFDIPVSGTQAHAWIQSFDSELEAFRSYARSFPDKSVMLVDTYDTLKSGIPNAITVAKELEEKGHKMVGIRLDSGDLAYLSKEARKMLDEAGFDYVKIAASNQLDEHLIRSLNDQGAEIDLYGVGTSLITGQPDAALDGVYKMCSFDDTPRMKISENIEKVTLPGLKSVSRLTGDGVFRGDVIQQIDEANPKKMIHPHQEKKQLQIDGFESEPLLSEVVKNGNVLDGAMKTAKEASAYRDERLRKVTDEYKRFENPHIYKIGISEKLWDARENWMNQL
jgi:nicotinate phosphoribosyltransferase